MLAVHHASAGEGSTKGLEVTGYGPVGCHFSIPFSFLAMCSSLFSLSRCYIAIYQIDSQVGIGVYNISPGYWPKGGMN